MELIPIVRDLGFPIALVIYFLWEASRVAKRIDAIQEDRLVREREFAESFRSLVSKNIAVVDKNNTINERILQTLELKEAEEETRIIRAFDPSSVLTPPIENRPLTDDESTRHRAAIERIKHRSPRPS